MSARASGGQLFLISAGFLVWSSAFVLLYAMLSVGCRFGWDEIELFAGVTLQRAQLVAIFLVHLGAGAWLVAMLGRHRASVARAPTADFLISAAYGAAVAALAASILTYAGVFALTSCY